MVCRCFNTSDFLPIDVSYLVTKFGRHQLDVVLPDLLKTEKVWLKMDEHVQDPLLAVPALPVHTAVHVVGAHRETRHPDLSR